MNQGLFITFEGIEGAGKSTLMRLAAEYLQKHQINFIQTREPGGTVIAEAIREIVLPHRFEEKMAVETEVLLMFASRAQHLARVIRPAISEGKVVLCDRFTDTSFAYQGAGRGIPEERIVALANWVHPDIHPDFTILVDVPIEIGLARAKKRSVLDRIEKETKDFFERVRAYYLDRAKRYINIYHIIDGTLSLEVMQKKIDLFLKKEVLPRCQSQGS